MLTDTGYDETLDGNYAAVCLLGAERANAGKPANFI